MRFELFHYPATCSRVVLTALLMCDADVDVTLVPLHRGAAARPLALNPLGQVPVLIVDGRPVTECAAILPLLARQFPNGGLMPSDDAGWAAAQSAIALCSSQLHPILTRIAQPHRYCDLPEARDRIQDQARAAMHRQLLAIDGTLTEKGWWRGEEIGIADFFLAWITGKMARLGVDLMPLPAVTAHLAKVRASPLFQQVIEREREAVAQFEAEGDRFDDMTRGRLTS